MSISQPPLYGQPDGQRGYYSAQKELATIPKGQKTVTFDVPANAETIVAMSGGVSSPFSCTLVGQTTGANYAGAAVANNQSAPSSWAVMFDVSSPLDTSYTMTINVAITDTIYIYADAGTHLVADVSKWTNSYGVQYVISTAPSLVSGDHPPVELQYASGLFTASSDLVAAPGVGQRIRVFGLWMTSAASGTIGLLTDNSTGTTLLGCVTPTSVVMPVPLTGLHLSINAALHYVLDSGTGGMLVGAYYTVETV